MANFADLWDETPVDKTGGLQGDFANRIKAANEAWLAKTGKPLPINSGARTSEEGIKLWGQRRTNPNLVARPGTSLHEKGAAADIPVNVPDSFLAEHGLHRPFGKKDPVHVEANPLYAPKTTTSNSFADLWDKTEASEVGVTEKPKTISEVGKQFGKEVMKPLSEMSWEGFKKESILAPALEYTAASIGLPGFTEEDKKAAQNKLVEKGGKFIEGVKQAVTHPIETAKAVGKEFVEHPGRMVGETIKGTIYDPELLLGGEAVSAVGKPILGAGKKVTSAAIDAAMQDPAFAAKFAELKNRGISTKEALSQAWQRIKDEQTPTTGMANVGAAQVSNATVLQDAISKATPELKAELQKLKPEEIDVPVLERQLEADSLPVPIKLSEGQATRSPQIFSEEMNSRGKNIELANRYNEQNKQLIENIDQIKENAAPEVYGTNHVENGQSLIDSYLDIDANRLANIDAKYQALRDAAGGQFPIDGVAFADNALNSLKKNLKTEFLPDSIMRQVNAFKRGEPMTFEQFEAMRTNLASEMRKADRAGDGNAEFALSKVREALEDLPLTGETKELKVLANEARSAAKERFDTLASDKAYKAAINGKVAADDFIQKFVIGGKKDDINTMVKHLGEDSQARQVMAAGVVNWLKSKAGILNDGSGTFSQKGFNKALESIDPKILAIVGPEVNQQLKALGRTARNIQERPAGAYVNESNTFTSALAEKGKKAAELGLNYAVGGNVVPVGTMARTAIHNVKEAAKVKQSLKPGAGIKKTKLSDIGK